MVLGKKSVGYVGISVGYAAIEPTLLTNEIK